MHDLYQLRTGTFGIDCNVGEFKLLFCSRYLSPHLFLSLPLPHSSERVPLEPLHLSISSHRHATHSLRCALYLSNAIWKPNNGLVTPLKNTVRFKDNRIANHISVECTLTSTKLTTVTTIQSLHICLVSSWFSDFLGMLQRLSLDVQDLGFVAKFTTPSESEKKQISPFGNLSLSSYQIGADFIYIFTLAFQALLGAAEVRGVFADFLRTVRIRWICSIRNPIQKLQTATTQINTHSIACNFGWIVNVMRVRECVRVWVLIVIRWRVRFTWAC